MALKKSSYARKERKNANRKARRAADKKSVAQADR